MKGCLVILGAVLVIFAVAGFLMTNPEKASAALDDFARLGERLPEGPLPAVGLGVLLVAALGGGQAWRLSAAREVVADFAKRGGHRLEAPAPWHRAFFDEDAAVHGRVTGNLRDGAGRPVPFELRRVVRMISPSDVGLNDAHRASRSRPVGGFYLRYELPDAPGSLVVRPALPAGSRWARSLADRVLPGVSPLDMGDPTFDAAFRATCSGSEAAACQAALRPEVRQALLEGAERRLTIHAGRLSAFLGDRPKSAADVEAAHSAARAVVEAWAPTSG
jgi:hypothetical protein